MYNRLVGNYFAFLMRRWQRRNQWTRTQKFLDAPVLLFLLHPPESPCFSQQGFDLHQYVISIFVARGCTRSVLWKHCHIWWQNPCLGCRGSVPLKFMGDLCCSRLSWAPALLWSTELMLGWVQGVMKMLPALMCGTSIGQLQATDYIKVLEHEWQSAGDHLKGAFPAFSSVSLMPKNPNQHWNEAMSLTFKFLPIYLFQSMCINMLRYKLLYFKAAYSRRSQSV